MALKILVISDDVSGGKMAGPGIRAWEISRVLGEFFQVCLMVPDYSGEWPEPNFEVSTYSEKNPAGLEDRAREADVLIVQGYILHKFSKLGQLNKIIIVDLYVPFVLENIFNYMYKLKKPEMQYVFRNDLAVYEHQLKRGNLFLVANRDQFNLIAGGLLLLGRIDPEQASGENRQINSILEIPFGFREAVIPQSRPVLKEKIGFKKNDFLLLWGGVISNWFDPLTLIQAMGLMKNSHPVIKLLFLSTTHANPFLPEFDMARMAMDSARELGVANQTVFFNRSWIPYEERARYFGAADAGVSCHHIHIETRYSFRTRFLDYLNFDLPIVSTEGDYLSELLSQKGALVRVRENDALGLKDVIIRLFEDKPFYDRLCDAVKREKSRFTWHQVLQPLTERLKMIENQSPGWTGLLLDDDKNGNRKAVRSVKSRFPGIRRFVNRPLMIKIRRHLGW